MIPEWRKMHVFYLSGHPADRSRMYTFQSQLNPDLLQNQSLKSSSSNIEKIYSWSPTDQSLMDQYATVKPSCGNGCPEHVTSRNRVVVTSKSERSNKRKSIKRRGIPPNTQETPERWYTGLSWSALTRTHQRRRVVSRYEILLEKL